MKIYKPTYGTSMFYFLFYSFIGFVPMSIACGILLETDEGSPVRAGATLLFEEGAFWMGPAFLLGGVCCVGLLLLVPTILINLVAKAFSKDTVFLCENEIQHKGSRIALENVQSITLVAPTIPYYRGLKRFIHTPPELYLRGCNKENLWIKRPSVVLTAILIKRCANAKFNIKHQDSLWMLFLIGLGLSIMMLLAVVLLQHL